MSNLSEVKRITVGPIQMWGDGDSVTVLMESGELTTPDGFVHPDGIYRVSAKYTETKAVHTRAKTFKGETAWMKAENLFGDIVNKVQYAR